MNGETGYCVPSIYFSSYVHVPAYVFIHFCMFQIRVTSVTISTGIVIFNPNISSAITKTINSNMHSTITQSIVNQIYYTSKV